MAFSKFSKSIDLSNEQELYYYCNYCFKSFPSDYYAKHFIQNHVNRRSKTMCPICDQCSASEPTLDIMSHMKEFHNDRCRLCTKVKTEKMPVFNVLKCPCEPPEKDDILFEIRMNITNNTCHQQ